MRTRHVPSDRLLHLADFQGGVVSRGQCVDEGLTRHSLSRLCREGWRPLGPAAYFILRTQPGFRAWGWAAILHVGDRASLGFEAAAYALGWLAAPPALIDVWVPGGRQLSPYGPVRFHRDLLGRRPVGRPGNTDRADTALDLCARSDAEGMVTWLARASRGGTRSAALRRELARRTRQPRRALVAELLAEVEAGAESPLEVRFVREVLRAHGLPVGERQVHTVAGRVDLLDRHHGVAIELDGRLGHAGEGAFRDARRDNRHAAEGIIPLRYGWSDTVGRPCATAGQVARVLRTRGWGGTVRPCRRPACASV